MLSEAPDETVDDLLAEAIASAEMFLSHCPRAVAPRWVVDRCNELLPILRELAVRLGVEITADDLADAQDRLHARL